MTGYVQAHTHTQTRLYIRSHTQTRERTPLSDGRTDNGRLARPRRAYAYSIYGQTHADARTRRHENGRAERVRERPALLSTPAEATGFREGSRETRGEMVGRRRSGNERRTAEYNIFIKYIYVSFIIIIIIVSPAPPASYSARALIGPDETASTAKARQVVAGVRCRRTKRRQYRRHALDQRFLTFFLESPLKYDHETPGKNTTRSFILNDF